MQTHTHTLSAGLAIYAYTIQQHRMMELLPPHYQVPLETIPSGPIAANLTTMAVTVGSIPHIESICIPVPLLFQRQEDVGHSFVEYHMQCTFC